MLQSKITNIKNVSIIALFEPETADTLSTIQEFAVDVVAFYTELLGYYPHPYLVIVAGSEKYHGGYPLCAGIIAIHRVKDFTKT